MSLAAVNLCVLLTAACANTPVLVYAMGHLRAAAVVAERLSDDGHSRVWVVTN